MADAPDRNGWGDWTVEQRRSHCSSWLSCVVGMFFQTVPPPRIPTRHGVIGRIAPPTRHASLTDDLRLAPLLRKPAFGRQPASAGATRASIVRAVR